MKRISKFIAFAGLCLTVGAAGGADTNPLAQSVLYMLAGMVLLLLSEYLYTLRVRGVRKAWFRFQKNVRRAIAQKRPVPQKRIGSSALSGALASPVLERADS